MRGWTTSTLPYLTLRGQVASRTIGDRRARTAVAGRLARSDTRGWTAPIRAPGRLTRDDRTDVDAEVASELGEVGELDAREAERIRRRDRDAEAERRELLRPGMGKVFKQILDTQVKRGKSASKRRED